MAKRKRKSPKPKKPSQSAKPKQPRKGPSAASAGSRPPRLDVATVVIANLLVLGTLAVAAILQDISSDLYYASVQEDELLEWATFWAFIGAAVVGILAALQQRRSTGKLPWFLSGVSLFSFLVAMEEISWGQRVLGYRPPAYFLEHNFQQELNIHNVWSTDFRQLLVMLVILGFGVTLPLLARIPPVRNLLDEAAIVAPPAGFAPAFFVTWLAYWLRYGSEEKYLWTHTGEWVELMLGLGFLYTAIVAERQFRSDPPPRWLSHTAAAVAGSTVLVLLLGAVNATISRGQRAGDPATIEAAKVELEALKRDFLSGKVQTKCNRHRRLYTFMERYDQDYLLEGEFSELVEQGLPEERAEFFLDPWNSPYWIRDRCKSDDKRRRIVYVYSFGPNRKRESSRWEIKGDDIAAVVLDRGRASDD